jgi:hypothetical protein
MSELLRRDELILEMEEWLTGERSHTNLILNTTENCAVELALIAAMDAAEVMKLSAAITAYSVAVAFCDPAHDAELERQSGMGGTYQRMGWGRNQAATCATCGLGLWFPVHIGYGSTAHLFMPKAAGD